MSAIITPGEIFTKIHDAVPEGMWKNISVVDVAELAVLIAAAGVAYWQIQVHRETVKSEHTKDLILQILTSERLINFETELLKKDRGIWGAPLSRKESKGGILELNKILSTFENIAVFVKNGLVDETLLIETLAPIMIQYRKWTVIYLDEMYKRSDSRKSLMRQFVNLAEFWEHAREQDHIKTKIINNEKISKRDLKTARESFVPKTDQEKKAELEKLEKELNKKPASKKSTTKTKKTAAKKKTAKKSGKAS